MTVCELKSTGILALIFACRMLGLFMILPILTLYTEHIPSATPVLMGLAAGIYGFTQAFMQFPCGILSDHFGRKPVILAGLGIFIFGSLVAAFFPTMIGLIIGRALQGVGAVGSPMLAYVADVTRAQVRTKAMAIIGISIGLSFVLAMILGPIFDAQVQLQGLFVITALLGMGSLVLVQGLPTLPQDTFQDKTRVKIPLKALLQHQGLWRLALSIFLLHAVLVATFLSLPHQIQALSPLVSPWQFYVLVLAIALVLMVPLLRLADDAQWQKRLLPWMMLGLGLATLFLGMTSQFGILLVAAVLFFFTFNYLEASFPAIVSQLVPEKSRGSALGIYSFAQFLGMFSGGIVGGCLQQWFGLVGIAIGCTALAGIGWLTLRQLNYQHPAVTALATQTPEPL